MMSTIMLILKIKECNSLCDMEANINLMIQLKLQQIKYLNMGYYFCSNFDLKYKLVHAKNENTIQKAMWGPLKQLLHGIGGAL